MTVLATIFLLPHEAEKGPNTISSHFIKLDGEDIHRKKRFTSFPSPAGMSLTKLSLGRNNSVMTSLFPPREGLVVTSRLGTGNSRSFFYGVCESFVGVLLAFSEFFKIVRQRFKIPYIFTFLYTEMIMITT
jgi:hypothetical protein